MNSVDKAKYMCFLIKDDELLEKYNEIWEKVKNCIKKEFDSEPACNEKYLKVKIKSYNGKINTNFHYCKIPKEEEPNLRGTIQREFMSILVTSLTTNVPIHIETSQLIYVANQLTGFYMEGKIGR